ncbi:hypothetical protein DAPPUDRAFT_113831 [Daphnia pulex]|uniref:Helitron helicase-like domain-containing protein n=1 Tax=Daphnia pulex TaxID=6669 RepID=E9HG88_DAPPU|nr:hypothetical protein DAPPUDRAFT_113831 [Daphnia pulex]|eukprot:EFX69181.1 hypothetical protein DAPPUDRAFT_113831 [Daphnia pulex]
MERLREEREETEELMRAMDAFEHAEMIPLETDEERSHREKILEERNRAGVPRTHRAACKKIESEANVPIHYCGEMNLICEECGAKHFKEERPQDKKFQKCCKKGRVILPPPKECPEPLAKLLQNDHPKAKHFISKIRNYNSAHAFASMGASMSSPPGRGPYFFRIYGQVYHNTAAVGATDNPKYADLYFMDAAQASSYRANVEANGGCCRDLMEELDEMLRENNPYPFTRKCGNSDRKNLDQRRYNSPTTDDIAIIFKSVNGEPPVDRDIRGHILIPSRGRKFIQINPQKPMCDPMTYPLLFPNERKEAAAMDVDEGEEQQVLDEEEEPDAEEEIEGDDDNDPHRLNRGSGKRKRVTQCEFYSYLISIRDYFNQVLAGGPLTQQWIVDSFVKIEANRVK